MQEVGLAEMGVGWLGVEVAVAVEPEPEPELSLNPHLNLKSRRLRVVANDDASK
jgi:hypothetical protein